MTCMDSMQNTAATSGDARMAFETAAENLPEVERNAVARLLGHTPETAEKQYRMRTPTDAFLAQLLVKQIAGKTRNAPQASLILGQWEPYGSVQVDINILTTKFNNNNVLLSC
ncbi:hypothetical protein R3I93_019861 [Phoxinus phoxinus]|uniref:Uncharacterized protein n=1 Tax=Phoxinus phoxinus TaxID=58324 RepID=A0AAN9CBZ2_9TELE